MKVIITGSDGQLGSECRISFEKAGFKTYPYNSSQLDITNPQRTKEEVFRIRPNYIVNCAAITGVDYCEDVPEKALLVNGIGVANLATAASYVTGTKLIQISTNAVFDGLNNNEPYKELDQPTPQTISAYAASKLIGEISAKLILKDRGLIVRTSWLYGRSGKKNFVKIILEMVNKNQPLEVVTDESASPTLASDLAEGLAKIIQNNTGGGVYHLAGEGIASRFDFAKEILRISGRINYPLKPAVLDEYLSRKLRKSLVPRYSPIKNNLLKRQGIILPEWRESLKRYLDCKD